MPTNQTLLEDMVTLGGNIMGNLLGARHEMKSQTKQHLESILRRLNLVSREEFDAAFAMLSKARLMQEQINERLKAIESELKSSHFLRSASAPKKAGKTKVNLPSVKKDKRQGKRK